MSLSYPISLTNAVGSYTGGHIIYLFTGSNRGGERAAALYTLIGSAQLNGLDPERSLRHVMNQIADHPSTRTARRTRPYSSTLNIPPVSHGAANQGNCLRNQSPAVDHFYTATTAAHAALRDPFLLRRSYLLAALEFLPRGSLWDEIRAYFINRFGLGRETSA